MQLGLGWNIPNQQTVNYCITFPSYCQQLCKPVRTFLDMQMVIASSCFGVLSLNLLQLMPTLLLLVENLKEKEAFLAKKRLAVR